MQSSMSPSPSSLSHEKELPVNVKKEEKRDNVKIPVEQDKITQTPKAIESAIPKKPDKSAESWMSLEEVSRLAALLTPLINLASPIMGWVSKLYSQKQQTEIDKFKIESHNNIEIEKIKAEKEVKLASIHADTRANELATEKMQIRSSYITAMEKIYSEEKKGDAHLHKEKLVSTRDYLALLQKQYLDCLNKLDQLVTKGGDPKIIQALSNMVDNTKKEIEELQGEAKNLIKREEKHAIRDRSIPSILNLAEPPSVSLADANSNLARIEEKSKPSLQGMFGVDSLNSNSNSSRNSNLSPVSSSVVSSPSASIAQRRGSKS